MKDAGFLNELFVLKSPREYDGNEITKISTWVTSGNAKKKTHHPFKKKKSP